MLKRHMLLCMFLAFHLLVFVWNEDFTSQPAHNFWDCCIRTNVITLSHLKYFWPPCQSLIIHYTYFRSSSQMLALSRIVYLSWHLGLFSQDCFISSFGGVCCLCHGLDLSVHGFNSCLCFMFLISFEPFLLRLPCVSLLSWECLLTTCLVEAALHLPSYCSVSETAKALCA